MVKLQVYQRQENQTFIDEFEANDFEDFILVAIDFSTTDIDAIRDIHSKLEETGKTVLVIDKNLDISFYGIVQDDTDAS